MKWSLPTPFLQQLPLLALFVVPLTHAAFGWRKIRMKSAVHFQQGTMTSSPWRVAVMMSILSLPQFCFWCLLIRGPSSLFFLIGSCLAVPISLFSVSPILHYIPSPSVVAYVQHRFQSGKMRLWISTLQALLSLLISLLLLFQTTSLLVSVTSFSFYIICPLIVCVSFIAVVFSGHSSLSTPPLIFNLVVIAAGLGIFLYFGIEDVTSFSTIVPMRYSLADSVVSLCVGFVLSFYQMTASPMFYQAYFPLSTIHKLRLSLIFHAVFQILGCSFVFLLTSLFSAFLEKHCNLTYSFSSLFQFVKVTVPHRAESYLFITSIAAILFVFFQWQLLSLTTHIWEEFLKVQLRILSPIKQLRVLQLTLLMTSLVLIFLTIAIRFINLPVHEYTPTIIIAVFTICSIFTGVFFCGYYFPCCNYKGGLSSLFLSFAIFSSLFYLHFSRNGLPELANNCFNEAVGNVTVQHRAFNLDRVLSAVASFPLHAYSAIALLTTIAICVLISTLTGGQDQMSLDWNLVVFPCTPLMKGRANYGKRQVIESESFRFAQQLNIPPQETQ